MFQIVTESASIKIKTSKMENPNAKNCSIEKISVSRGTTERGSRRAFFIKKIRAEEMASKINKMNSLKV